MARLLNDPVFSWQPKIRAEAQQLSAHEQNIKKTAD
jgi:hypothetical protein